MKPNIQRDVPQLERSVPRTGDDLVLVNFPFDLLSHWSCDVPPFCGMSPEAKHGRQRGCSVFRSLSNHSLHLWRRREYY